MEHETSNPTGSPIKETFVSGDRYRVGLTHGAISAEALMDEVRDLRSGAVVTFLGTVREITGELQTTSLMYEAYSEMALSELARIVEESHVQWPLVRTVVVHRLGPLALGDIAIGLALSSPHRREAFEAIAAIMDRIKQTVPIWKKETWADGASEWIHPDTP